MEETPVKKIIIIISAVLLVLALAVTIMLVVVNNRPEKADDEDCRYPYSFTRKQNDILVTIEGERPEGYAWTVVLGAEEAVGASVESEKNDKTVVRVSPVHEGYASVTFVLTREDILPDNVYAINVSFSVSEDKKMSVVTYTHLEMQGLRVFGRDGEHTYCFSDRTDRSTVLSLDRLGEDVWSTWSEGDCLGVNILSFENGTACYLMTPRSEGVTRAHIYDAGTGKSLTLEVEVTAELMLLIRSSGFDTFDPDRAELEQHQAELEAAFGKLNLPEGAVLTYCGHAAITLDDTVLAGGSYIFTEQDVSWFLSLFPGASGSDLLNHHGLTVSDGESITVSGAEGRLCTSETELTLMWVGESGVAYALSADTLDRETFLAMAQSLYAANPNYGITADE